MAAPTSSPFDPAEYIKANTPAATSAEPPIPVDPIQLQQFDPNAFIQGHETGQALELQGKYGTGGEQVLAGAEALARGASLGLSDVAEQKLAQYLPTGIGQELSPEAVKARQQANPLTSFGGEVGGGALIGGPLLAGAKAIGLGGLGAEAALGSAFGAGQAVSEAALGDPDMNAQKVLAHVGMGAALGTGFGLLGKAVRAAPAFIRNAIKPAEAGAEGGVLPTDINAPPSAEPIVDIPIGGKKATSYEELKAQIDRVKKYGGEENFAVLPQKPDAEAAAARLAPEMNIPITDMQLNSLNSQDKRLAFKTMAEVPGEEGQLIRDTHVGQKKELNHILDQTIEQIAPQHSITTDAQEAGERAADAFSDVIQSTRNELRPALKQIKETPLQDVNHLDGVLDYLTNPQLSVRANPKIANMFDTSGSTIEVKPYTTGMGIDRATYKAIKDSVASLKENPEDFEKLFDIRKGLAQNIDVTSLGDAAKEIGQAKAAMMDYIQDSVQKLDPNLKVRDVFARYAKNEEAAQMIEKKFGAEIGTDNFRSLAKGKPEESILKKIFSDSATVQAAKAILPQEKFAQLLADYIAITKQNVTDQGSFSANKFYSQISKGTGKYAINEAFLNHPEQYQKLKDVLTTMRAFTDDMPINPSGTAKTLLQAIANSVHHPASILGEFTEFGKDFLKNYKLRSQINQQLAGVADKNAQIKSMDGVLRKVTSQINENAKAIFNSNALKAGAVAAGFHLSDAAYHKIANRIRELASNPQAFMSHMADNTDDLNEIAPNLTQSLSTSVVKGLTFLQSKMPQPTQDYPLSPKWEPNKSQLAQFAKYYEAINNPINVLKQVNRGNLTSESMEALQAVHPELLAEMRQNVIKHMNIEKAKKLNYTKKLSLSKFLGQPLDGSMTPQMVQASQQSFNPPPAPTISQPKKPRTNVNGLKNLKVSKRTQTQTNRDEE